MFAKVCFHHDLMVAEMIRNVLLENGLHPANLDYSANISVAGVNGGYYVEVPKEEAGRAEKILSENGFGNFVVG